MNPNQNPSEQAPRSKDELFAERNRLMAALRHQDEKTRANIAAGVIGVGDRDQEKEALEAELAEIIAEIDLLAGDDDHSRLEGI